MKNIFYCCILFAVVACGASKTDNSEKDKRIKELEEQLKKAQGGGGKTIKDLVKDIEDNILADGVKFEELIDKGDDTDNIQAIANKIGNDDFSNDDDVPAYAIPSSTHGDDDHLKHLFKNFTFDTAGTGTKAKTKNTLTTIIQSYKDIISKNVYDDIRLKGDTFDLVARYLGEIEGNVS